MQYTNHCITEQKDINESRPSVRILYVLYFLSCCVLFFILVIQHSTFSLNEFKNQTQQNQTQQDKKFYILYTVLVEMAFIMNFFLIYFIYKSFGSEIKKWYYIFDGYNMIMVIVLSWVIVDQFYHISNINIGFFLFFIFFLFIMLSLYYFLWLWFFNRVRVFTINNV